MNLSLDFIVQSTGGRLVLPAGGSAARNLTGVSIDSRSLEPGALFIALRGEKSDGYQYLSAALERGAAALMLERMPIPAPTVPIILVLNSLQALQDLAHAWRMRFDLPLVAVTGSVGKTSIKDLLAACLQSWGPSLKTPGNYNNQIGLPLTLLQLEEGYRSAVIEMGMRALGEIYELAAIAQPDYALISNVEAVHLETMGNLNNIAQAKAEVLHFIGADGFAVINGDQNVLRTAAAAYPVRCYHFGWSADCEFRILKSSIIEGELKVDLDLLGKNTSLIFPLPAVELAANIAAVAGTAYLLGIELESVEQVLATADLSRQRLQISELAEGGLLINDAYNASPASMRVALRILKEKSQGRRSVAVLGNMFELGDYEQEGHLSVGRRAAELGIDQLLTVGDRAMQIAEGAAQAGMSAKQLHSFTSPEECLEWMREGIMPQDAVLFKASRGMQLEQLIEAWLMGRVMGGES